MKVVNLKPCGKQEVKRLLERAAQASKVDLEAWETPLRAAVLSAGAKALGALIEGIGCGQPSEPL